MFSVIIPTLQRSGKLKPLIELYSHHHLVKEVLVINNAPAAIEAPRGVRVLDMGENIYVNPAWNLVARVVS